MSEPEEAPADENVLFPFNESQSLNTQDVSPEDLDQATELLDQKGRIALCGPPKSGKSSLGHALLKHYHRKGFAPYLVHKLCCHFQIPASEKGRTVILMDGALGVVRAKEDQLYACKDLMDRCLLILTIYPHVLRDMNVVEEGVPFPLLPPHLVIDMKPRPQSAVVYLPLLKRMLHDKDNGHAVEALLALSMLGGYRFDRDPSAVKSDLQELGFGDVMPYSLKQLEYILKDSILHSTDPGFPSRLLYDAAGLALGRFYSLPVMLRVCDGAFMVQHVRISGTPTESVVMIGCSDDDDAYDALKKRMYEMFMNGQMSEVCQHPSLGCPAFMEKFQAFCKNYVVQLVTVADRKHGLPLLYWSLWNKSTLLTEWCLRIMREGIASYKVLSEGLLSAVLATVLFAETDFVRTKARGLLAELLHTNVKPASTETLIMALPLPTDILAAESPAQMTSSKVTALKTRGVRYLDDPAMPIPAELLSVTVAEEVVIVEMPAKHWYLAMRMLTDRERGETDNNFNTLLHLAADSGHLPAIKIAVKSGASITATNHRGRTPYELAQKRPRTEKGKKFTHYIASFHEACKTGDIVAVKVALCHKARVNDKGSNEDTPLITACRAHQSEVASLLIQLGASVDSAGENGYTPLLSASESGDIGTVRMLLSHRARINEKDVIKGTPLHAACRNGHTELAAVLIERGAMVNAKDSKRSTPLHAACWYGHHDSADLLIRHRAEIDVKNVSGWTPLHVSSRGGHSKVVALLLEHSAQVNAQGNSGLTPLHLAAREGRAEVADLLIQKGAQLNAKDERDWTPLHEACRRGHMEVANLLKLVGADVSARNKSVGTAADCARAGGHTDLVEKLFS